MKCYLLVTKFYICGFQQKVRRLQPPKQREDKMLCPKDHKNECSRHGKTLPQRQDGNGEEREGEELEGEQMR